MKTCSNMVMMANKVSYGYQIGCSKKKYRIFFVLIDFHFLVETNVIDSLQSDRNSRNFSYWYTNQ